MEAISKKYHKLTCVACRRKKGKCDGLFPVCSTCKSAHNEKCVYDKPASISYVRYLEKQVGHLDDELARMRDSMPNVPYKFISLSVRHNDLFSAASQPNLRQSFKNEVSDQPVPITNSSQANQVESAPSPLNISSAQYEELTKRANMHTGAGRLQAISEYDFFFLSPAAAFSPSFQGPEDLMAFSIRDSPYLYSLREMLDSFASKPPSNVESSTNTSSQNLQLLIADVVAISDVGAEKSILSVIRNALSMCTVGFHRWGESPNQWLVHGFLSKLILESNERISTPNRLSWAVYTSDMYMASLMNRESNFKTLPFSRPDDIQFNLLDLVRVKNQSGTVHYLDTRSLVSSIAKYAIILGDILSGVHLFLPIRNELLGSSNAVYDSVPKILRAEYYFEGDKLMPVHLYTSLYSVHCGIRYILLAQQFEEGFQSQIVQVFGEEELGERCTKFRHMPGSHKQSNESSGKTTTFSYINDSEMTELVEMTVSIEASLASRSSVSSPPENASETVIGDTWLLTVILDPLCALLSNDCFIKYAEQQSSRTADSGTAKGTVLRFFVCLLSTSLVRLSNVKTAHSPKLRDVLAGLKARPLKVLNRAEFKKFNTTIKSAIRKIRNLPTPSKRNYGTKSDKPPPRPSTKKNRVDKPEAESKPSKTPKVELLPRSTQRQTPELQSHSMDKPGNYFSQSKEALAQSSYVHDAATKSGRFFPTTSFLSTFDSSHNGSKREASTISRISPPFMDRTSIPLSAFEASFPENWQMEFPPATSMSFHMPMAANSNEVPPFHSTSIPEPPSLNSGLYQGSGVDMASSSSAVSQEFHMEQFSSDSKLSRAELYMSYGMRTVNNPNGSEETTEYSATNAGFSDGSMFHHAYDRDI